MIKTLVFFFRRNRTMLRSRYVQPLLAYKKSYAFIA